jgi:hypothetical protein
MPLDSSTNDPSTNDPSIWSFIGPAAQIGAGLYGSLAGSGQAEGGYNNAYGSAQTGINTSAAALGPYQTGGSAAVGAYQNLLGLGGQAPNFAAFTDSPGYKFEVNQGNQAIQRAANAAGNGFSSTTLAQLGAYDQGLASTHYQQYLQNMYGLIGVGANAAVARGNQALTGAGIAGGAQVGAGVSRGVGDANASGVVATGLSKLPWGQIGSGISSLFGHKTTPESGMTTPSYGTPSYGHGPNLSTTDLSSMTTRDLFGAGNYSSFQSPNLSSTDVNGMSTTDLFGPGTYTPSFDTGYSGGFNGNPG